MAGTLIGEMAKMIAEERQNVEFEMVFMERTRRRFVEGWNAATDDLRSTGPMKELFNGFNLQVTGMRRAGLLPPADCFAVYVRNELLSNLFVNLIDYPPLLQVEHAEGGSRSLLVAIPAIIPEGNQQTRRWRRLEDEACVLLDKLRQLSLYVDWARDAAPYWSNIISFSTVVAEPFSTEKYVMDVKDREIYVCQYYFPSSVALQIICAMWEPVKEGRELNYHIEFTPLEGTTEGGETAGEASEDQDIHHSVILWNARGVSRRNFWEAVQYLHRRFLPDVLFIFNTGVSADTITGVGTYRLDYDGMFSSPVPNHVGGITCFWYRKRINVGFVNATTNSISYYAISIGPKKSNGVSRTAQQPN